MGKLKKVTLRSILETHDAYAKVPGTLPQALGDGYLYQYYAIFKNVRDTFLALGGRFDVNPPFPYDSYTLVALCEILEHQIVPVTDNIYWYRKLEEESPNTFNLSHIVAVSAKGNYIFHESAHCVAHKILKSGALIKARNGNAQDKKDLVKIMLGESFANTVEFFLMCMAERETSFQEQFFLKHNVYFNLRSKNVGALISTIGERKTAEMAILIFLLCNFLWISTRPGDDQKIMDFAGIDPSLRKNKTFIKQYQELKKLAFMLNPNFRVQTAELYLRRVGFRKDIESLMKFNPLTFVLKSPELQSHVRRLAQVIDGSLILELKLQDRVAA